MKANYVKVTFRNGETECYRVNDFKQRGSLVDLQFDDNNARTIGNVSTCEAFTLERIKR